MKLKHSGIQRRMTTTHRHVLTHHIDVLFSPKHNVIVGRNGSGKRYSLSRFLGHTFSLSYLGVPAFCTVTISMQSSSFFSDPSLPLSDLRIDNTFCTMGRFAYVVDLVAKAKLIHSFLSAGSSVMAAYVEIVFDNSDGKVLSLPNGLTFHVLC